MEAINPIEIAGTPYGAYILAGIIIGFPIGYAAAIKTVLKQARSLIDEQRKEIVLLRRERDKYLERLLTEHNIKPINNME